MLVSGCFTPNPMAAVRSVVRVKCSLRAL
jgi:hypothetical protein